MWENALPLELCRELRLLHDLIGTRGYRPSTEATHMHAVLASHPQLVLPLLQARDLIRELVLDFFGSRTPDKYYYFEFSGILVWLEGSQIGWHHDANRDYLEQRLISSVAYLNSQGSDFTGGTFMFEDGQEVKPAAGTLIAYFSDDVHSVTEVTSGRRYTMPCWFSDKAEHSECCKLLTQFPLHCPGPLQRSTIPAEMFHDESGEDLRVLKLRALGFDLQEELDGHTGWTLTLAGKGKEGEVRISVESLDEALRFAIYRKVLDERRASDNADPLPSANEMKQRLEVHNQDLEGCVRECWEHSIGIGMDLIYLPDKFTNTKLFPS